MKQEASTLTSEQASSKEEEYKRGFIIHYNIFIQMANEILFAVSYFNDKSNQDALANNFLLQLEQHVKTAEQKIEVLSKFTERVGIANYSDLYTKAADEQRKSAELWIRWAIVMIITTMGVAVWMLTQQAKGLTSNLDVLQFTITKIVVLTCLFLSIAMCLKNYKTNKHNAIVNINRSNALLTFDALNKTNSAGDAQKEMYRAVTNTIFGNMSTGYNTSDKQDVDLMLKVLDRFKISQ
jgi:hypothetical protein